jgi:hypothetical protein
MSTRMLSFVIAQAIVECKSSRYALVADVDRTADDTTTPLSGHGSLPGEAM